MRFVFVVSLGLSALPGLRGLSLAQTQSVTTTWTNYKTILWIGESAARQPDKLPLFYRRLREMNINTAMVYGDADPRSAVDNGFPYYVENIINRGLCLKWNSKVMNWDAFVTDWAKTGRPQSALVRDYCLDDPGWRAWACQEVRRVAAKNRQNHPVAYNLRDELSTTVSANPFDYDFNPTALAGFRQWLRTQYRDLPALNAEWDTHFVRWEEVRPFTTDEIKCRMASGQVLPQGQPDWHALEGLKFDPSTARQSPLRWNFAPWADFRSYMDLSLARALGEFREMAHQADPLTPVGIEGTQMPAAFGGCDLWRLSRVLDWVEPYDIGSAREILGSFMQDQPIVTTVFESDTRHALRRLWHLLLEGDRGCIVWWSEDCLDWKSPDYRLTAKGRALAPALKEMTSPLAALFLRAQPERDPVYLLYSQPSIQADWLLESTGDGSTWLRRFSSYEAEHNKMLRDRAAWLQALEDIGCSPQFISTEELETGRLRTNHESALILSDCIALSAKTLEEIREFQGSGPGRQVFWDCAFGEFDEHCKLCREVRAGERESATEGKAPGLSGLAGDSSDPQLLADWLAVRLKAPFPHFHLPPRAHVRNYLFDLPSARLLALERNISYHMSEDLKQTEANAALEKPVEVDVLLPESVNVYNLRTEAYMGLTNRIHLTLDPWQPSLYALTSRRIASGRVVSQLLSPN